jgi:tetratricopeptide (TPR) repeat protein
MSRISTIVSESERKNITDKSFAYKFSFLLIVIIVLSIYIILQGYNVVDTLSSSYKDSTQLVTLESIEREINGNSVNLLVIEDDFSELASIDLSDIKLFGSPTVEVEQNQQIANRPNIIKTAKTEKNSIDISKPKKKKVFITSQEGNSLSFIKKKFYATNNAAFSIKLAKKFYESKKYKQALKWSLITNEIDPKSEESWIMFAKIKEKMGKKQDAINALNEYLKHENSKKATILLKKIQKSV